MAIFGAARGTVEIMKEKAILHKINELFEYRGIRDLASELGQMDNGVYDKLIEIQYRIFLYDKHLEQFEYPLRTELERLWKVIVLAMKDLGCSDEQASELLSEIETYARNELAMRQGVKLNSLPISYFYYYKSCDVRLMRKLLRWKAGTSSSSNSDFRWYIFDWVTEVNDDVSDVQEDRNTFNGNRFGYLRLTLSVSVFTPLATLMGLIGGYMIQSI